MVQQRTNSIARRYLTILMLLSALLFTSILSLPDVPDFVQKCLSRKPNGHCSSCLPYDQEEEICPQRAQPFGNHNLENCIAQDTSLPNSCILCQKGYLLVYESKSKYGACIFSDPEYFEPNPESTSNQTGCDYLSIALQKIPRTLYKAILETKVSQMMAHHPDAYDKVDATNGDLYLTIEDTNDAYTWYNIENRIKIVSVVRAGLPLMSVSPNKKNKVAIEWVGVIKLSKNPAAEVPGHYDTYSAFNSLDPSLLDENGEHKGIEILIKTHRDRSVVCTAVYKGVHESGKTYEQVITVGNGYFNFNIPEKDASANAAIPSFGLEVTMTLTNDWKTIDLFSRSGFLLTKGLSQVMAFNTKDFQNDTYNVDDDSKPNGGGWCECPSGKIYQVAKNGKECSSGLACTNGKDLLCQNGQNSELAYKSVYCDIQDGAIKLITSDTEHAYYILRRVQSIFGLIQNVLGEMHGSFIGKFDIDENGVKFMKAIVLGVENTERPGAQYGIFDSDQRIWHLKISNAKKIVYPQEYLDLMKAKSNKLPAKELMASENLECQICAPSWIQGESKEKKCEFNAYSNAKKLISHCDNHYLISENLSLNRPNMTQKVRCYLCEEGYSVNQNEDACVKNTLNPGCRKIQNYGPTDLEGPAICLECKEDFWSISSRNLECYPKNIHQEESVWMENLYFGPDNKYSGSWGGECTCPNGQTYPVGDNHDMCGSLACVGGEAGVCHKHALGDWSGKRVICGLARQKNDLNDDGSQSANAEHYDDYRPVNKSIHGGFCQCPSGSVYAVATHSGSCPHLSCVGGTKSSCYDFPGPWAYYGVVCNKKKIVIPGETDDSETDDKNTGNIEMPGPIGGERVEPGSKPTNPDPNKNANKSTGESLWDFGNLELTFKEIQEGKYHADNWTFHFGPSDQIHFRSDIGGLKSSKPDFDELIFEYLQFVQIPIDGKYPGWPNWANGTPRIYWGGKLVIGSDTIQVEGFLTDAGSIATFPEKVTEKEMTDFRLKLFLGEEQSAADLELKAIYKIINGYMNSFGLLKKKPGSNRLMLYWAMQTLELDLTKGMSAMSNHDEPIETISRTFANVDFGIIENIARTTNPDIDYYNKWIPYIGFLDVRSNLQIAFLFPPSIKKEYIKDEVLSHPFTGKKRYGGYCTCPSGDIYYVDSTIDDMCAELSCGANSGSTLCLDPDSQQHIDPNLPKQEVRCQEYPKKFSDLISTPEMIAIRKNKDLNFYTNQELLASQNNKESLSDTTPAPINKTLKNDIHCTKYKFNIRVPNMENQCGIFNGAPLYCGLVYEPFCHETIGNITTENTDQNYDYEGQCTCPNGGTYLVGAAHNQNCSDMQCEGGDIRQCQASSQKTNLVIERAVGVGYMGGICTCADGSEYSVGDNNDNCESLACDNGTSGICNKFFGPWAFRKVVCGNVAQTRPRKSKVTCSAKKVGYCKSFPQADGEFAIYDRDRVPSECLCDSYKMNNEENEYSNLCGSEFHNTFCSDEKSSYCQPENSTCRLPPILTFPDIPVTTGIASQYSYTEIPNDCAQQKKVEDSRWMQIFQNNKRSTITSYELDQLLGQYSKPDPKHDTYIDYDGEKGPVGFYGGYCTCPSGKRYMVGDNNDNCQTMACIGGTPGSCYKSAGDWSKKMVKCFVDKSKVVKNIEQPGPFYLIFELKSMTFGANVNKIEIDLGSQIVKAQGNQKIFISGLEYNQFFKLWFYADASVCHMTGLGGTVPSNNENGEFTAFKGAMGSSGDKNSIIRFTERCTENCSKCIPVGGMGILESADAAPLGFASLLNPMQFLNPVEGYGTGIKVITLGEAFIGNMQDSEVNAVFLFGKLSNREILKGVLVCEDPLNRGVFIAKREPHFGASTVSFALRNSVNSTKYFVVNDPRSLLDLFPSEDGIYDFSMGGVDWLLKLGLKTQLVPVRMFQSTASNFHVTNQREYFKIYKVAVNCYYGIKQNFLECLSYSPEHECSSLFVEYCEKIIIDKELLGQCLFREMFQAEKIDEQGVPNSTDACNKLCDMNSGDRCDIANAEMKTGHHQAHDGDLPCPVINLFCKTIQMMTNRDNRTSFSPANSLDPIFPRDALTNPRPIPQNILMPQQVGIFQKGHHCFMKIQDKYKSCVTTHSKPYCNNRFYSDCEESVRQKCPIDSVCKGTCHNYSHNLHELQADNQYSTASKLTFDTINTNHTKFHWVLGYYCSVITAQLPQPQNWGIITETVLNYLTTTISYNQASDLQHRRNAISGSTFEWFESVPLSWDKNGRVINERQETIANLFFFPQFFNYDSKDGVAMVIIGSGYPKANNTRNSDRILNGPSSGHPQDPKSDFMIEGSIRKDGVVNFSKVYQDTSIPSKIYSAGKLIRIEDSVCIVDSNFQKILGNHKYKLCFQHKVSLTNWDYFEHPFQGQTGYISFDSEDYHEGLSLSDIRDQHWSKIPTIRDQISNFNRRKIVMTVSQDKVFGMIFEWVGSHEVMIPFAGVMTKGYISTITYDFHRCERGQFIMGTKDTWVVHTPVIGQYVLQNGRLNITINSVTRPAMLGIHYCSERCESCDSGDYRCSGCKYPGDFFDTKHGLCLDCFNNETLPECLHIVNQFVVIDTNIIMPSSTQEGFLYNKERLMRFYLDFHNLKDSLLPKINEKMFKLEIFLMETGAKLVANEDFVYKVGQQELGVEKEIELIIEFKSREHREFKFVIKTAKDNFWISGDGPNSHAGILSNRTVIFQKSFSKNYDFAAYWSDDYNFVLNLTRISYRWLLLISELLIGLVVVGFILKACGQNFCQCLPKNQVARFYLSVHFLSLVKYTNVTYGEGLFYVMSGLKNIRTMKGLRGNLCGVKSLDYSRITKGKLTLYSSPLYIMCTMPFGVILYVFVCLYGDLVLVIPYLNKGSKVKGSNLHRAGQMFGHCRLWLGRLIIFEFFFRTVHWIMHESPWGPESPFTFLHAQEHTFLFYGWRALLSDYASIYWYNLCSIYADKKKYATEIPVILSTPMIVSPEEMTPKAKLK